MRAFATVALLALTLAACGVGGTTPSPTASPTQDVTPQGPDMPSSTPPPVNAVPHEIVDEVVADAAQRASVAPEQVAIERATAVTWNDGSLGCREPGMMYIQVLVDGYWVVVRAGDETHDYRIGRDGTFKLCPPGQGEPPAGPLEPHPTIEIPPPIR